MEPTSALGIMAVLGVSRLEEAVDVSGATVGSFRLAEGALDIHRAVLF